MNKIYQVFISSTFEDLQDERKEVMQALLELDCMPAGMELFPASNDDQWTLIKRVIDACDYYLLIIGGRYGSTNELGISYTQMEFEYALACGKPIISFLPKRPENIPSGKCEQDALKREKLEQFKNLAKKKLVKYWENPENLGSLVSRSMIKLIKDFPAEGWVKADSVIDEKSIKEISKLQKENFELKEKLHAVSVQAPEGTSNLQQGTDLFAVKYTFLALTDSGYGQNCEKSIEISWNELFSTISPSMIDDCDDLILRECLNELIKHKMADTIIVNKQYVLSRIENIEITTQSFGLILVQFRALGLIQLSAKHHVTVNNRTYWSLTPYGDYVMTQLLALKK